MGSTDTDRLLEATTGLIPPLLTALDVLGHAVRHFHPPKLPEIVDAVAPHHDRVTEGLERFRSAEWPDRLARFVEHCERTATATLEAIDGLQNAMADPYPIIAAYRSMRKTMLALEALYPLAPMLPPVSRFFTTPGRRDDEALAARLSSADPRSDRGVMHASNRPDERGGFSLYVPEYQDDQPVPLIVALHGGSGHGRSYLWTWLRDARTRGAILVTPSSRGDTWSLMGPDLDGTNLDAIVAHVKRHWNVDDERVLLAGMSDGGTFAYVTGLRADAPFTHLAVCSASFHPLLLDVADPGRLRDLPIYLVHGALDWMFSVAVARAARDALSAAGAAVEYREIDDLSHTYAVEENDRIIDWLTS